jgi:putative transposase
MRDHPPYLTGAGDHLCALIPKRIYHQPPSWVGLDAIFFITICSQQRGTNPLCIPGASEQLLRAADYYHSHARWYLLLFLLMPDHLHALVAFPPPQQMGKVIRSWKIYTSRQTKVKWQRDFFDHRLDPTKVWTRRLTTFWKTL